MDIMTKAVVGNSCRIRSFTQFEIKTRIFYREMSKWLRENEFEFFEKDCCMMVSVDDGAEAKIYNSGTVAALTENVGDEYHDILQAARNIYEYCSVYEKSAPLKAERLSEIYRCLAEFNGTVLAAKYSDRNEFEFVTWNRTYDGMILSILLYTIFSKKRVFWITTKIHSASLCEFWW